MLLCFLVVVALGVLVLPLVFVLFSSSIGKHKQKEAGKPKQQAEKLKSERQRSKEAKKQKGTRAKQGTALNQRNWESNPLKE